jgi:hypothetical protein
MNLAEAAHSTVPYTALDVSFSGIVRAAHTRSAGFTVQLKLDNLDWLPTDDGRIIANLILAAVSLSEDSDILASKDRG